MPRLQNQDVPIEVVFKCLLRDYKELQVELGKERSYNDELDEYIKELEEKLKSKPAPSGSKKVAKEIKEQQMYQDLKNRLRDANKSLKEAYKLRDEAMSKVAALEKRLEGAPLYRVGDTISFHANGYAETGIIRSLYFENDPFISQNDLGYYYRTDNGYSVHESAITLINK